MTRLEQDVLIFAACMLAAFAAGGMCGLILHLHNVRRLRTAARLASPPVPGRAVYTSPTRAAIPQHTATTSALNRRGWGMRGGAL